MRSSLEGASLYYNPVYSWERGEGGMNGNVTPVYGLSNESDMTTLNFTTDVPLHPKPCQHLLYLEIPNSR